jgi:exopolysaccharide biosynthesis polyprenyl glycosylphosphotransferase
MIKEHVHVFKRLAMAIDLIVVALSAAAGWLMYYGTVDQEHALQVYGVLLPLYLVVWFVTLHRFDTYLASRVRSLLDTLFTVWKAALVTFVVFGSIVYFFRLYYFSRGWLMFVTVQCWLFLSVEKILIAFVIQRMREKGFNFRNILLVGTGKRARRFIDLVEQHREWGLRIIGMVDEDPSLKGSVIGEYKVIGSFDDLADIVHNTVVDEVIFVVPRSWIGRIEPLMCFCEAEGIKIHVAVDYFELRLSRASQSDLGEFPLLTFETGPALAWSLLFKRFSDMVISGLALIALSPLLAAVACVVKLTSPGPVFFKQKRSTINGRTFMLYKFRTMVVDAEARKKELMAMNEMKGPAFKMQNDPRVTPIGRFLRKTSIDELPQFWNVFKGDMSLIGPRPPLPDEVKEYDCWHRRRLSMRPGLSCLWQISGRNKIIDFDEWVKLDLQYIDNWSLWLDIKIFFKTIPVVLFGTGAK